MRRRSKGTFVLVAVAAALFLVVAANVAAYFLVDERVDWLPSLVTAVVVGGFVALIVFRPKGSGREHKRTEFTVEGREVHPEHDAPRRERFESDE